jgi:ribosomal protein S18 acetylase RimI-like enzyme
MEADNIVIRRMVTDDIGRVSELNCGCYSWLGEKNGFTTDQVDFLLTQRGNIETIAKESKSQVYLVVCINDTIAGMTAVNGNEIAKLFVNPNYHRKGIGTKLFNAAEKIMAGAGYNEMIAGVMACSAIGFYEKMGMSKYGEKESGAGAFAGYKIPLMRKVIVNAQRGNV